MAKGPASKKPEARFRARVLAVVRRIPAGRVATYGEVAALAGSPRAGRSVGTIMSGCRDAGTPCHRVVGANGAIGGWSGPAEGKRMALRAEGIRVGQAKILDFQAIHWLPRRER
jgi:O-6-methylguanine DNA methyltransferase